MAQENVWNREYKNSKLLTLENKPQSDVLRFVQFLRKEEGISLNSLKILDLGSGTGRNSYFFAEMGNSVTGLEISKKAIEIAEKNAKDTGLDITYKKQSIGEKFPIEDDSIDIALDITSSNSLTEAERENYLKETQRVLKTGGYFFVKALCKEGDLNAKNLLKQFPGKEMDTYIMPGLGLTERVWSKEDFCKTFDPFFKVIHLKKKTSYSKFNNRSYKRNFWVAYMKK
jgi:ubiquinone/menaquinone biosynthesis C-methylase UbiE